MLRVGLPGVHLQGALWGIVCDRLAPHQLVCTQYLGTVRRMLRACVLPEAWGQHIDVLRMLVGVPVVADGLCTLYLLLSGVARSQLAIEAPRLAPRLMYMYLPLHPKKLAPSHPADAGAAATAGSRLVSWPQQNQSANPQHSTFAASGGHIGD